MFDIEYKGANTVVVNTKSLSLVTDPKLSLVGLKDASTKHKVVLATEERFAVSSEDTKLVIAGPGEYEVGNFSINGRAVMRHIDTEQDGKLSTLYRIEVGDVAIGILGNISSELSDDDLEVLGVVDILAVPVGGGGYTIDATNAVKLVRQIEPKVVIPLHYADSDIRYEVPQDGLETFVKELGLEAEHVAKYKVKSLANIPETTMLVVVDRTA